MAGSLELARAYVQIVPSMQGVQSAISNGFGDVGQVQGNRVATQFTGGLRQSFAGGAVAGVIGGVVGAISTATIGAAGRAVGVAGAALSKGLKRALDIQDAEKKLSGLGNSAARITNIMGSALASVRGTAFGLGDAATVAASAVAAGIKPGQTLTRYLKLTADTATIAGTSLSDMGSVLNKATANGTVYTDTLNQLSDRGVPVFQYLAKEYKVTQSALSDMVRAGQVDSATLMKALQKNLAGSALKSGETARGAWANVGAALSRLGVAFTGGPVTEAPRLFTVLAATIDKLSAAITPLSAEVSGQLVGAMQNLSARMKSIDFAQVAAGAGKFATYLAGLGVQIKSVFSGNGLDTTALGGAFGELSVIMRPLWPLFLQIAAGVGQASGAFGQLISAGIPLIIPVLNTFTGMLKFLGDNSALVAPLIFAIVGAMVLFRTTQAAANIVALAAVPLQAAQIATYAGLAASNYALASAVASATGATVAQRSVFLPATAQVLLNTGAVIGNSIAWVASKVSMLAFAGVAKIAAAAQWLMNAALSANPIGIVVVAVAALVAGLIWFFTQTKIGQQIVAGAMKGIAVAITWIQSAAGAVVGWLRNNWPLLLSIVGGPVGAAVAFIVTRWTQIRQITAAVFAAVVNTIRTNIGNAVGFLTGLPAKAVAAFGQANQLLLDVGANIVAGLVQGIRNGFNLVIGAATALAQLLPDWVKKVLGIRSPSRVFASIGRYVGQGLVKGLTGSQDQVKTAATSLVNQVTDAFTKLADQREAAQKRLVKLNQQLAGTSTRTKSGRAAASRLRGRIGEQRALLADIAAAPKGARKSSLLSALRGDTRDLTVLAGKRDKLADQFKTAQDRLAAAVGVRDDFAAQVRSSSVSLGNIADAYAGVVDARKAAAASILDLQSKLGELADSQKTAGTDAEATRSKLAAVVQQIAALSRYGTDYAAKLTELQGNRIDLASTLAEQMAKVADYSQQTVATQNALSRARADSVQPAGSAILSNLQDAITKTGTFQTLLSQLKSFGVDDTTYSQILEKNVAGGGIGAAQELVQGGPALVRQVAVLQGRLAAAGQQLGGQTSTVLYQAGVAAAQGSVDGIKAKIVDNQAAIALLQTAMAQSVKRLGINTSALTRNAGAQIVAGLTDGIRGRSSDLDTVISDLGKSAVNRLKKVLGIRSPSRVAREQVGQQFGAGFVLGIQDMHAAAEQAAAGLASIPTAAFGAGDTATLSPAPAPIMQNFNGQMGLTRDEVADAIATKTRRAVAAVNIPKVSAR